MHCVGEISRNLKLICLARSGHSPSEAFNETVEEATQSLYPLIGEKGKLSTQSQLTGYVRLCWQICQFQVSLICLPTAPQRKLQLCCCYPCISYFNLTYTNILYSAQRGALDWWKPFYTASKPVFEDLYESTRNGSETARSLDRNSEPDYREKLEAELAEISESEMWRYVYRI